MGKLRMRQIWATAALAGVLAAPVLVHGQRSYNPRDLAMLPGYCKYTQDFSSKVPEGNNPEEIKRWYAVMGGGFHHMHHYCWGLMHTNRATFFARGHQERMRELNYSINEFNYVIRNVENNFIMLPEILTKKGENLIRLGQAPQGMLELQRAIEIKPDYWPPYAALGDHFKQAGNNAKAREWFEKGLAAAPDTKALQRRLAELGGGKGERSAPPQQTKPQPPAENAASAPPPQTENPEPPRER